VLGDLVVAGRDDRCVSDAAFGGVSGSGCRRGELRIARQTGATSTGSRPCLRLQCCCCSASTTPRSVARSVQVLFLAMVDDHVGQEHNELGSLYRCEGCGLRRGQPEFG
jgi:hypothetical protein